MTTAVDLSAVFNPVLGTLGLILAGMLTWLANRAIAALQARNLLHLTDQQRAAVLGAVQTGAGILSADLARGVLPLAEMRIGSRQVRSVAQQALAAVPVAAAALGMTEAGAAAMVVGAVGRALGQDPTVPTVPVLVATTAAATESGGVATAVSSAVTSAAGPSTAGTSAAGTVAKGP